MNNSSILPTFAFVDEYGNLAMASYQRFFSIGAIISSFPDDLNDAIHQDFECLCSILRKDPSRLEFHFTSVTKTSVDIYLKALDRLLEYKDDWRFCSIIIDREDKKYKHPRNKQESWECYLRYLKMLMQNNIKYNERVVMIADYQRRPTGKVHKFATLHKVVPNLVDTLKVESQGVLLVQLCDLITGGFLYSGTLNVKKKIHQKVKEIEKAMGKKGFNVWRVKWE
jgi:hypothetical protein